MHKDTFYTDYLSSLYMFVPYPPVYIVGEEETIFMYALPMPRIYIFLYIWELVPKPIEKYLQIFFWRNGTTYRRMIQFINFVGVYGIVYERKKEKIGFKPQIHCRFQSVCRRRRRCCRPCGGADALIFPYACISSLGVSSPYRFADTNFACKRITFEQVFVWWKYELFIAMRVRHADDEKTGEYIG